MIPGASRPTGGYNGRPLAGAAEPQRRSAVPIGA